MPTKLETFNQSQLKMELPDIRPGDVVKIYQKISYPEGKKDAKKERKEKAQIFEGQVLARKHGGEIGATIVVRKVVAGVGVERTFPLHSPSVEKIEIVKRGRVRRAKLYYLRGAKGRKARLKRGEFFPVLSEGQAPEKPVEIKKEEADEARVL